MSDFQSYLDDALSNIKLSETVEDKVYEDYDIYAEISAQISSIRSSAKMTQKELAKECGLTQANISNIEKGMSKPTVDSLKKIADALGKRLRIEFEEREEIN